MSLLSQIKTPSFASMIVNNLLGEGAMGRVFSARHRGLGRPVAVKVMSEDAADDACARQRFEREARLMARIDSRHVVRILEFNEGVDGAPSIVLEKVDGVDVGHMISEKSALARGQVRTIVNLTAEALECVHRAGVVHCDVKAENVLLTSDGGSLSVRLIDFGVARAIDSQTEVELESDRFPCGTPVCMSPEQIIYPKEVRRSWDLWGLAVMAYTALTGFLPHDGDSLAAILFAAAQGTRLSVSGARADVDPRVDDVFRKAFAHEPEDRYESATAFAFALGHALAYRNFSEDTKLEADRSPTAQEEALHVTELVNAANKYGALRPTVLSRRS
jgi:eukaryotic-like serine/threonine-protein kinase